MNPYRIYSRKTKGLDNTVWVFMIMIMILSLGLLSSFLVERKKCISFSFKISPNSDSGYYTEKTLSFSLSTSAKNVTWDFGDGTDQKKGVYASHQYHKEGKYYVTARIKQDCEEVMEITVKKSPLDHTIGNEISGPETIAAEKDVEFNCLVYANTWSWIVKDHPEIKPKNEKLGSCKFRFTKEGTYYIQVTLDDNRTKSYTKEIVVTDDRVKPRTVKIEDIKPLIPKDLRVPKENIEPEIKPTVLYISDKTFKDKLITVLNDDNSSTPLEGFYKYLSRREETDVKITGVAPMKFNTFYYYLRRNNNNITISNVELIKDPEDKTKIDLIRVTIPK